MGRFLDLNFVYLYVNNVQNNAKLFSIRSEDLNILPTTKFHIVSKRLEQILKMLMEVNVNNGISKTPY